MTHSYLYLLLHLYLHLPKTLCELHSSFRRDDVLSPVRAVDLGNRFALVHGLGESQSLSTF